jgi:hypothetical protein
MTNEMMDCMTANKAPVFRGKPIRRMHVMVKPVDLAQ